MKYYENKTVCGLHSLVTITMSFLGELQLKKKSLKPSDTIITLPDGRRFCEQTNESIATTYGFVVDTKPDNVPSEIIPNLFLGSQDCCEETVLKKYGITNVLSIGIEPLFKYEAVNYLFVECLDLPESNVIHAVTQSIPFISCNLARKSNVLVHCNAGVSRSSSVVIGFLIFEQGLDFEPAYSIVKKSRSCCRPNPGFEQQLRLLTPP